MVLFAVFSFMDTSIHTTSKRKSVNYNDSLLIKFRIIDSLNKINEKQKFIVTLQNQIIDAQIQSLKR